MWGRCPENKYLWLSTCPGHNDFPTWFLNLFAVTVHDKLMFYLCKHILVHAHLLFLFSLCFSNYNDAIPDYNNKNEAEQKLDTVIP